MKTLYLDIFSGLSGDMFLGAMVDLGVDPSALETELGKLPLTGYHLHQHRDRQQGIAGCKFDVHLEHDDEPDHPHPHDHHPCHHAHSHADHAHPHSHSHTHTHVHALHGTADHRSFANIRDLIRTSALSEWVKQKSIAVFERLAIAEAGIHGVPTDEVHFHEVGAVDSIVDIVGACICLEQLGKPRVLAAPVVEGTGFVRCAHGEYPLPAPATLAILAQRAIPLTQCAEPHELLTPTGAALLAEFAESFGPLDHFSTQKIGFGLGTRENRSRPNVVRALLGSSPPSSTNLAHDWESDRIAVLETNLDDVRGELLGHLLETALAKGALDVFHTPIQMKKNRPGVLLTVLCVEADADKFAELILSHSSAFGVRRSMVDRRKLRRDFTDASTPWGTVKVKRGWLNGRLLHATPEYESCRQLAETAGVPLRQIYEASERAIASSVPAATFP